MSILMPDLPTHLIVSLLALLIASKKEDQKYVFLLLPLAIIPDFDTFVRQHRAVLHNMFIPSLLLVFGYIIKEKRNIFIISAVYIASHVIMDLFGGGVVLFYPLYSQLAFVDASLQMSPMREFTWTFDYGFKEYSPEWIDANGYVSESTGTGAIIFVLFAGMCVFYRALSKERGR